MLQDPFQLLFALFGIVLFSLVLERNFSFVRKLSLIVVIFAVSATLSNSGIIAIDSPFYGQVTDFTVPFAVCLALFLMRLSDIKKVGLPMLVAFTIASIGSFIGVLVAGILLDPHLRDMLGPQAWKLAGPFAGSYTGGSLNFFALWDGLDIENPALFAAANAVDVMFVFPIVLFLIAVPDKLQRFFPVAGAWKKAMPPAAKEIEQPQPAKLKVLDITALCFVALAIMYVSEWMNSVIIRPTVGEIPTILVVTTLALIVAHLAWVRRLEGAKDLSDLSFYVFFAAVGAQMSVKSAIFLAPVLFLYVCILVIVHLILVFILGRLFRLDVRILAVASMATKEGPAMVLALANSKGWTNLALPGMAAGLLGYAIGNYIGFGAAHVMRWILGV